MVQSAISIGNFLFIGFLATSLLLILADYSQKKYTTFKTMNYKYISIMGIFQGLAILPGLSRSGSTVTSSLVLGVNKEDALEYSFLLSIPIILASLLYELIFSKISLVNISISPMIIGFIASSIFGIISIKFMIKLVKKNNYKIFSIYKTVLGIVYIIILYTLYFTLSRACCTDLHKIALTNRQKKAIIELMKSQRRFFL